MRQLLRVYGALFVADFQTATEYRVQSILWRFAGWFWTQGLRNYSGASA